MNSKELSVVDEIIEVTPGFVFTEKDTLKMIDQGMLSIAEARKILGTKSLDELEDDEFGDDDYYDDETLLKINGIILEEE